jgi:type I restriction enzyme S subunit
MKSSEFTESGVPVLNVGCVQPGWIDISKCDYLPEGKAKAFERYRIQAGDVLFTRSGTVGRCAIAGPGQAGHVITFHLLRVRPDRKVCLPKYLWAAFQGAPSIRRQTDEGQIGSTRSGFNTGLLSSLDVPVPPLVEQHEIVRRVDALFALADTIEKQVEAAITRADYLMPSILAKAFRGELVPTEAELARQEGRDYEPASVLLERIRAGNVGEDAAGQVGVGRRESLRK